MQAAHLSSSNTLYFNNRKEESQPLDIGRLTKVISLHNISLDYYVDPNDGEAKYQGAHVHEEAYQKDRESHHDTA